MHLHRLTFAAVGPFPGRHTVDVASLGAGGIFLLEGPTGAGKSTLIDMVVFALYGKVASRDASEDRLRSAHAEPGAETFVDLVLETGAGVYRVRRTPAYERPKQRGAGTTTQQASVRLWRLTDPDRPDDGELLSTRLDEAGAELQRAVGLDREQFVQTVVLPQGEFAGFLRAKPEDRRGLLQKVFGTDVYEQVQERLERLRADAHRQVQSAEARIRQVVAGFAAAAALDDEQATEADAVAGEVDGQALRDLVENHRDRRVRLAEDAAAEAERDREACAVALAALDGARTTAARVERRRALRAELAVLEARADDVALATARRDAARQAASVQDALDAAEHAGRDLATADDALTVAREAAPPDVRDAVQVLPPAGLADALVVERDRCTGLLGSLEHLAAAEAGLPGRRAELHRLEAAADEARLRLAESREALGDRGSGREDLLDRLGEAREAATALGGAQAEVTVAEERLAAADDVATLTVDLAAARERLGAAVEQATRAVQAERDLRTARLRGIAGELAGRLVAGEPCVVCGGTDHPDPAAGGATVDGSLVEDAEDRRVTAERAVTAATGTVAALQEQLTQRERATGGLDQDAAKAALIAAQHAVQAARTAAATALDLTRALQRFDEETLSLEQRVARLDVELAEQRSRIGERRTAVDTTGSDIAAALDGCASVQQRRDLLRTRADAVGAWRDALQQHDLAHATLLQRVGARDTALRRGGFADAAAARAACLSPVALRAVEQQVEQHGRDVARVTHALGEPELATLPEDVVVGVAAAEQEHAAADRAATLAAGEAASARSCAQATERAADQVLDALRQSAAVRAEAAPVIRMANVAAAAGGDNAKQLTLATYVLTRRFEDVVAAANGRLTAMSAGRYELQRSEEKEAVRSRRTGLAMKVLDHHTGLARDPRTLSGGETFYVSLCLALGLADVVTAEAGGTDLGTLFVDEGFGTLDPETLDVVLAELGRLREGGRVVGVVSHVEALKQAIAERIEVRHLPDGGSTLTVRA